MPGIDWSKHAPTQKSKTMVFPPTRVAYDALLKRVKALEEEVKRLRNEKKDTGRSPAEVKLQPKTSKARHNSWTDIYNETTALHKNKRLLGQDAETDDGLEWRVKWGQRGTGVSGLLTLICWVAAQNVPTTVFAALVLVFAVLVY